MGTLTSLVARLDAEGEELRARFFAELVRTLPHARGVFPAGASTIAPSLLDALRTLLVSLPDAGVPLPDAIIHRLRAAALDMRRFGFPSSAYATFAEVLNRVLDAPEAADVIDQAAAIMAHEADAADQAGIPPATAARIAHVEERGSDGRIKLVRLEAGIGLGYRPGQYVPVLPAGRQGAWVNLAPALPANPFGQLEFHVDGELDPVVGTYVTVGAARGEVLDVHAGERVLIVALGTGAAVAKALVFDILERADGAENSARPEIDLLLHAPSRRDHYDVATFSAVAELHPWLRVHRAPLGATVPPELVDGRTVIICGPAAHAEPVAEALRGGAQSPVHVISPDAPQRWL
ncbi:hypothetical protein [Corynebacterium sp. LK2510]|uniref:hypothetical protein n=1 Tax=Corynebacterium sp. LK2510 TaxID=3110472 RepID=UPI0034CD06EC